MNGNVRIGGALIAGIIIIFGALRVSDSSTNYNPETAVVVATAPERSYIESPDSDNDGTKDWEENLAQSFPNIAVSPTVAGASTSVPYTPPTTLTGKFSQAFFQDYMTGKMNGQDFSDPTEFVNGAVSAIERNTESVKHTRLDLNIVPSTPESLRTYGNDFANMLVRTAVHSEDVPEAILQAALTSRDSSLLQKLTPFERMYTDSIAAALAMPVPNTLVDAHLAFLNAVESQLLNIHSMQVSLEDPLFTLARLKSFATTREELTNAFNAMRVVFENEGITFENAEPGSVFYLFEAV